MTVEFLDLLQQRATILRAPVPVPSPSGVTRKVWSTTVVTKVACSVQRGSGRQIQTDAGQFVEAQFHALVTPVETDVVAGDRFVVDGVTYDVLLVPKVTNLLPHLRVDLAVATPGTL